MSEKEKNWKVYRYWIYLDPDPKPWSYIGNTNQTLYRRAGGPSGYQYALTLSKFGAAIDIYGFLAFEKEILQDGLTQQEAFDYEQFYIEKFNSIEHGWNISTGGKSGASGTHVNKGKCLSEEQKKQLSEMMKGHIPWNKGKLDCFSEEANRKRAESNPNKKSVLQFTKDGQFIAEYSSIKEASRQTGINSANISQCCLGRLKSAGKSKWYYKDN